MKLAPVGLRVAVCAAVCVFAVHAAPDAFALPSTELLQDINGDGRISILAFGDSITSGYGDYRHRYGYPGRLQAILKIPVKNDGLGGEVLATLGYPRLKREVRRSSADLVILNEGNSDAYVPTLPIRTYRSRLNQAISYILRSGKHLLISTQYPVTYKRSTAQPRLNAVNREIRSAAAAYQVGVIEIDRAWNSTCKSRPSCRNLLYVDGLHPNANGYDVITDLILAQLAGIDIFAPGGAAAVEAAYHLKSGSVMVKVDE